MPADVGAVAGELANRGRSINASCHTAVYHQQPARANAPGLRLKPRPPVHPHGLKAQRLYGRCCKLTAVPCQPVSPGAFRSRSRVSRLTDGVTSSTFNCLAWKPDLARKGQRTSSTPCHETPLWAILKYISALGGCRWGYFVFHAKPSPTTCHLALHAGRARAPGRAICAARL
jgi:hypothetical protein